MKMLQTAVSPLLFLGTALLLLSACDSKTGIGHGPGQTNQSTKLSNSNTMNIHADGDNIMMQSMSSMMDKMHHMKMTGDPDRDFAEMMIIHHEGAIDMAKAELAAGKDTGIRAMAAAIVTAQEAEVAKMRHIASSLPPGPQTAKTEMADDLLMKSMSGMMDATHTTPMTGDVDKDFVLMMTPHHEGAVAMAKVQLQQGKNAELKRMAQQMIDDQNREIAQFRKWLADHP